MPQSPISLSPGRILPREHSHQRQHYGMLPHLQSPKARLHAFHLHLSGQDVVPH